MQSRSKKSLFILLALIGAAAALPGCYTRTIESEGLGTRWEQRDIYKPNVEADKPQQSAPSKSKRKGGLFNNIGEFFFGSDDG